MEVERKYNMSREWKPTFSWDSSSIRPWFARYFGAEPRSGINTCAIGFEANVRHMKKLRKLAHAYTKRGWRTHFFHAGILF